MSNMEGISHADATCEASTSHAGEITTDESVELHRATLEGNWNAAAELISANQSLVRTQLTDGGEIALHIAAKQGNENFVAKLLEKMGDDGIEIVNRNRCTSLCFASAEACRIRIANAMIGGSGTPYLPRVKMGEMPRKESTKLYEATLKGDWKAAEALIRADNSLVRTQLTGGGEIALHVAALQGNVYFVSKLLGFMENNDLRIVNNNGCTSLCFAAAAGHTHIAQAIVNRGPELAKAKGENGFRPVYMAAVQGFGGTAQVLYDDSDIGSWPQKEQSDLLTVAINSHLFGLAAKIVNDHKHLAIAKDSNEETPLLTLARSPLAFRCNEDRQSFWDKIIPMWGKRDFTIQNLAICLCLRLVWPSNLNRTLPLCSPSPARRSPVAVLQSSLSATLPLSLSNEFIRGATTCITFEYDRESINPGFLFC